jgi:5-methylcytosine-specific restriction endonuclease McrA
MTRCMAKPDTRKRRLFAEQDGLCIWCREPMKLNGCYSDDPLYATIEHVISRSKGGAHDDTNMALAHKTCNERREKIGNTHS